MDTEQVSRRARLHAALGDPTRLAIVDELTTSDRSPSELADMLHLDSNLLAHHLGALEQLGIIERVASQGDRRRRYTRLVPTALASLNLGPSILAARIVFVCTENAARSQLAQAIWNQAHPTAATSAGTRPADRVHPGAIKAAARRGIDLRHAKPGPLPGLQPTDLVITVCDRAHETLKPTLHNRQLHWSLPDPAASPAPDAFDTAATTLETRIKLLAPNIQAA
ncbi:MAG TPA: helix-turn-helix domain-containing protein [Acidimicrobiales bacterium]|jgi:protein-tyrosine-phosphatase/DNA-binding HxlR family transcriptional regulator